jgi:predicted DNA-binding transcriptional regulator AlpA
MVHELELLNIDRIAELLHTSVGTVYYWRSEHPEKVPPALKQGRRLLWRRADVEAWLAEQPASASSRQTG